MIFGSDEEDAIDEREKKAEKHKSWCRILDIGGPCDCKGKPTREDWSAYYDGR